MILVVGHLSPNISQPKETETVNENINLNNEQNQNGDKINGNDI